MKVHFLGATQTVTGSRYLISQDETNVLVDCGLFQGYKALRLKNWDPFPFDPRKIDAIFLTHAHLDHSGYIPKLRNEGFTGPVFCTAATRDLCELLLPDSGHLQEEEARFANKRGFSKHKPALPLYTEEDAILALKFFETVSWNTKKNFVTQRSGSAFSFEFLPAGHLFGAASILIESQGHKVLFSGDLGREADPLTRKPNCSVEADAIVVESTYGNRTHIPTNPQEELRKIILRTFERSGTLLIPSFAVGRAQLILYYIRELKRKNAVPDIPVYLNSPMAIKANDVFCRNFAESNMTFDDAKAICATAVPIASVEESIALNERKDPRIIVAASGMATGGRVLHHLKELLPDPKNTVLFVGFQAGGTRGASIIAGATEVKIHGGYYPVRAEVAVLDSMSAHADGTEVLGWLRNQKSPPHQIFVTHGELAAADELRRRIIENSEAEVRVPEFGQVFEI